MDLGTSRVPPTSPSWQSCQWLRRCLTFSMALYRDQTPGTTPSPASAVNPQLRSDREPGPTAEKAPTARSRDPHNKSGTRSEALDRALASPQVPWDSRTSHGRTLNRPPPCCQETAPDPDFFCSGGVFCTCVCSVDPRLVTRGCTAAQPPATPPSRSDRGLALHVMPSSYEQSGTALIVRLCQRSLKVDPLALLGF